MKLVYKETQQHVKLGDIVTDSLGGKHEVLSFVKPHKPSASGFVTIGIADLVTESCEGGGSREVYVGVIGAEWIDREDRD